MALINCTECNKEISEKAKACPHCGCPNNQIRCPECSNFIRSEMGDCPKCGYPIKGNKPDFVAQTQSYHSPSMSCDTNIKKGCLIVGGVILLVFGIVANMFGVRFLGMSALAVAMIGYIMMKASNEH